MLLSRSLTSASGKVRSTRASPSTSPLRAKYPTPLLNRTTRLTRGTENPGQVGRGNSGESAALRRLRRSGGSGGPPLLALQPPLHPGQFVGPLRTEPLRAERVVEQVERLDEPADLVRPLLQL